MKVYIYPSCDLGSSGNKNPYLHNLSSSLAENGIALTNKKKTDTSIIHLFKNFRNTDFFIFNWIEDLPSRRFGIIQTILFYFFVLLCKASDSKIIWFRHNKVSHDKKYYFLKRTIAWLMKKFSALIISHSKDGLPAVSKNNFYFPHPAVAQNIHEFKTKNEYDILIWGEMLRYKGVHNFLQYCKQKEDQISHLKILIAGNCKEEKYFKLITGLATENIEIRNGFVSNKDLNILFSKSRSVLFIYENSSILSSGALIDTLCANRKIIGPSVSCFKELESMSLVCTYKSMDDIFKVLDQPTSDKQIEIAKYFNNYSWTSFSQKLIYKMNELRRSTSKQSSYRTTDSEKLVMEYSK